MSAFQDLIDRHQQPEPKPEKAGPLDRICDYCEEVLADGYVPSYDAHVCDQCYEDHHGPID